MISKHWVGLIDHADETANVSMTIIDCTRVIDDLMSMSLFNLVSRAGARGRGRAFGQRLTTGNEPQAINHCLAQLDFLLSDCSYILQLMWNSWTALKQQ